MYQGYPVYKFQSTHPLRGATSRSLKRHLKRIFQSTHPLRGATKQYFPNALAEFISIHAPLAGCDEKNVIQSSYRSNFNPRTPCGVRPPKPQEAAQAAPFQSTHPLRGATAAHLRLGARISISIHAPLAGCDLPASPHAADDDISIHAPLAGCDVMAIAPWRLSKISIHAPLAGCDSVREAYCKAPVHFNPRTPCGVRLCCFCCRCKS